MRRFPIAGAATAAALGAVLLAAAPRPALAIEAAELMSQVQTAFEALESYEREMSLTMDINVGGQKMQQAVSSREVAVPPGKRRSEMSMMGMTFLTVSDGSTTWVYNPMTKQYTEETAATIGDDAPGGMALTETGLASASEGATISRQETIQVDGRDVECHIIHVDPSVVPAQPGTTVEGVRVWLSESEPMILKVEATVRDIPTPMGGARGVITNVLTSYEVNPELGENVFTFEAPDGATKVESFSTATPGRPPSPLVGKPAPDFTGTTLEGESVTLSSLEGTVVLVDFWATWCGPCRRELPHIQKIHEEFGDDLHILAVSNEKRATIEQFIQKNAYSFPVVHDGIRAISGLYDVKSLPTVVIVDKDGNVAHHLIGLRTEAQLRAALAEAGLDGGS